MSQCKRVLITGASAGFGFDTAKALAKAGHIVFAAMRHTSDKNRSKAESLTSFAKSEAAQITVLDLDVTRQAAVDAAVETAFGAGGIDVLINNAGVGNWGIDEGFSVDQAEQLFAVNLFGVMRVNRAVVPYFRKAGRGLIIYLSSGLGRLVLPFMGIYTSSKFAVEAYAESVSIELQPLGIQTVIIQPGAYATTFTPNSSMPMKDMTAAYGPTAAMFRAFSSGFEERIKSGGLGDPAEVVNALVEEVERPEGPRPIRRPVGRDVQEPVGAINRVCEEVQSRLLKAFNVR